MIDYTSERWKKKRAKILRRDGYICQHFKRYGKTVEATMVHHIFPCEYFPEYQWDDWNLISLSLKAHNMMHDRETHELTKIGRDLLKRTAKRMGMKPPTQ